MKINSWRDQILKEFVPQVSHLTLVADPDGLLLEERVLTGIQERGFELIPFEDHVAFRFAYESKYRSKWDRGELTDLVVVLRAPTQDLRSLPYDLLEAGRQLSFSLADVFPNLSYPVLEQIDRSDLDALYEAQLQHNPGKLGDNATKDFILHHVFETAPELIKQPVDLLRMLLRRHYRGIRVPPLLDDRLMQVLDANGYFTDWPIKQILVDREVFFAFLQERWPVFLNRGLSEEKEVVIDPKAAYGLRFDGPADVPFDHDDIRVYIDSLFLEGHLRPIEHERGEKWIKSWAAIGLRVDWQADQARRFHRLLETIETSVPAEESRHAEWLGFAFRWAELLALRYDDRQVFEANLLGRFSELYDRLEGVFFNWMGRRYASLYNQPPMPPVMVHHLPRYLSRRIKEEGVEKIALLVVDGLSLDQWVTIRQELVDTRNPQWSMRENAVFAWVPTVTSVSRQATFAGKIPLFFGGSLFSTDKEPVLWNQFWQDLGLLSNEVAYIKGLGDGPLNRLEKIIAHPKVRAIGLVVDKVDHIMHGMELGAIGMHNQVRLWVRQGYIYELLNCLVAAGYEVHLTSDHGNIEAVGIGRPVEGSIADLRGERVRIYPNDVLRKKVLNDFPQTHVWPAIGLPEEYLPLMALRRDAFVRPGDRLVAHGSISLEEVIVPHVEIRKTPQ
jgi:hypothetical protein